MAKKSVKRRSRGTGFVLLLILLAIATIFGGYFYASRKDSNGKVAEPPAEKPQAMHLDLRGRSKNAHEAIDAIIAGKADWQRAGTAFEEKKEIRIDKKGNILWNQRKLELAVPANEDLETAASWLTGKVKAENLFVVSRESSSHKGANVLQLEIAIYGKAGEQEVKCVIDKITLFSMAKQKKYSGYMAVIIDDCGYDLEPVRILAQLPVKMTFAVLPFKKNSKAALNLIKSSGREAMLHLPMEPLNPAAASEGKMVTVAMTRDEARAFTREALASLPGISGVNNHQGSKATSNRATMKAVLEEVKNQGLYFIDSNTHAKSIGNVVAGEMGVRSARNQRFLDNSSDVEEIKKQIWSAAALADKTGSAVAICHARPATARAWAEVFQEVKDSGIKFVSVSAIVN